MLRTFMRFTTVCCACALASSPAFAAPAKIQFGIEVSGVLVGFFAQCTGMGSASEIAEHKVVDGAGVESIQKVPGRLVLKNITCNRPITSDLAFWAWRKLVEGGDFLSARQPGAIVLYSDKSGQIARWEFTRGWPSALFVPDDRPDSETLVLTVDGLGRSL
jgi:phage tail-like protein